MKKRIKNELADASITAMGLLLSEYLAEKCEIVRSIGAFTFKKIFYMGKRLSVGRRKRRPSRRLPGKYFACQRARKC
jgi:hypothetical protein